MLPSWRVPNCACGASVLHLLPGLGFAGGVLKFFFPSNLGYSIDVSSASDDKKVDWHGFERRMHIGFLNRTMKVKWRKHRVGTRQCHETGIHWNVSCLKFSLCGVT